MRLSDRTAPGGAMARAKGTANSDKKIGKKSPKIKNEAYQKGMMPKAKPRGLLKDNY